MGDAPWAECCFMRRVHVEACGVLEGASGVGRVDVCAGEGGRKVLLERQWID